MMKAISLPTVKQKKKKHGRRKTKGLMMKQVQFQQSSPAASQPFGVLPLCLGIGRESKQSAPEGPVVTRTPAQRGCSRTWPWVGAKRAQADHRLTSLGKHGHQLYAGGIIA